MALFDHLLVLAFAIAYPTYAYFDYRRAKNALIANKPGVRVRGYKETIVWLWSLGLLAVIVWMTNGRALADLGLEALSGWPAWSCFLVIGVAAVLLTFKYRAIHRDEAQRKSLRDSLNGMPASEFLPHTTQEARWFVGVSFSAGLCEEFLFRGFLIWYFSFFTTTALAVVFSSVVFGAAHSYQGGRGGLQAGAAGLILALAYVLTGSLWVPILLHVVGDIHSGILGWLAYSENEHVESV